jgi:malonyl-CoA O-methyltransferase
LNVHIDKQQVAKHFNQVAQTYDEYSSVHRRMACQVLHQLKESGWTGCRVLEVGCGTGFLTQLLLEHYPQVHLTAVDLAEKMIFFARQNISPLKRVKWIVGDIETMEWSENSFDLIISNATVHWLQQPCLLLKEWYQALSPNGKILVSTFGPNTLQELAQLFQTVELEMGLVPERHILTFYPAIEWEKAFKEAGYHNIVSKERWLREQFPSIREFLYTIKSTGEKFSSSRQNIITSSRVLRQVMNRYALSYQMKRQVYATYHSIYIEADKVLS